MNGKRVTQIPFMARHFSFTNVNAHAPAMTDLQRKSEVSKTRSKTEKERCLSG